MDIDFENKLKEACILFSNYLHVPFMLTSKSDFSPDAFEKRACFLREVQTYYQNDFLTELAYGASSHIVCYLDDPLKTHAIFATIEDYILLIGPFVSEEYSQKESQRLLSRYVTVDSQLLLQFKIYWCDLHLCDLSNVVMALHTILSYLGYVAGDYTIEHSSDSPNKYEPKHISKASSIYGESWVNSLDAIEKRYEQENRFMSAITDGNDREARLALHKMLNANRPHAALSVDLWSSQAAIAIIRTLIRISAKKSGLSPIVIDGISLNYAQQMQVLNNTSSKLYKLYEQMITDLCQEIRQMKETGYSPVSQRCLYIIRTHYNEPLHISDVAAMLKTSESTLARALKKDTGHTFTRLLTKERLKNAAFLLQNTSDSIQEISISVGISDQNYFVKLFRQEFDKTPSEFRRY